MREMEVCKKNWKSRKKMYLCIRDGKINKVKRMQ